MICKTKRGENVFVRVNNALDVNNLKNPVIGDVPNFSGANAVNSKLTMMSWLKKDNFINRKGNLRQCSLKKKDNTVLSLMVFQLIKFVLKL